MPVIIGRTYEMEVMIIYNETEYNLTTMINNPDATKVLYIDTIHDFDLFTNTYGHLEHNTSIGINWWKVFNDFKGFKLNSALFHDRFFHAYLNNKEYYSWWDDEYYCDDKIIVPNT